MVSAQPGLFPAPLLRHVPDYGYILLAILLSGIVSLILFIPEIFRTPLRFNSGLWKKLMVYSLSH
jgi:hypothetical protein